MPRLVAGASRSVADCPRDRRGQTRAIHTACPRAGRDGRQPWRPAFAPSYRFLAACYAHMGRLDEACAIVSRLRAITSKVVPSELPYRNPEDRELFLSGLRLAAGETA